MQLHRLSHGRLNIQIIDVLDIDWSLHLKATEREYGLSIGSDCHDLLVFSPISGLFARNLAELQAWATNQFNIEPQEGQTKADFTQLTRESFRRFVQLKSKESEFVYMKFQRHGEEMGTIIFELFRSLLPKACENFRLLCTGQRKTDQSPLHYLNTPIHRIVAGAWIQGGDIVTGNGDSTMSVFGQLFEDESFTVKHDRAGILSMANEGEPHTNGSQFFITLRDLPYLDYKKIAFGRIVDGLGVLMAIGAAPTCNERPDPLISISACGVYSFD